MRNQILRISELRKKAKQDVAAHIDRWDNTKRVLNSLIGTAATNRDWLDTAQRHYSAANAYDGLERLDYLVSSLFNVYRCEFRMENGRFKDETVFSLKEKVETSYVNSILDFLEENIHDESNRNHHLADIQQAISALSEVNRKLASGYHNMLGRYMQQGEVKDIIERLLDTPVEDITPTVAVRIKGIFQLHESSLRKNPRLMDHLVNYLRGKIEEVFLCVRKRYEEEEGKEQPSLRKLIAIIGEFETIYQPLRQYVYAQRYRDFIAKKESFDAFRSFIDEDYPELVQMYKYLSLPREIKDTKKLIALYHQIRGFHKLAETEYIEIKNLTPPLNVISKRFEKVLANVYRRDLMEYYQVFNRMINADDGDEKTLDMIRFHQHLTEKLDDDSFSGYLKDKLSEMRDQIRQDLDRYFESRLQDRLETATTDREVIEAFDEVLDFMMKIGDVERIEELQKKKKTLIERLRELRKLQERLDRLEKGDDTQTDFERLVQQYEKAANHEGQFRTPELDEFRRTANRLKRSVTYQEVRQTTPLRMVILDKFSMRNYVVFTQDTLKIGRNEDNDIILRSEWISGNHLEIDFTQKTMRDLESTNGTFINGDKAKITSVSLDEVNYFDIGSEMLVSLKKSSNSHIFRLQKVLDQDILDDPEQREYIQSLMNTEFVRLADGDTLTIHKISGNLDDSYQSLNDVIMIKLEDGVFNYSDHQEGIIEKPVEYVSDVLSERFSLNLS